MGQTTIEPRSTPLLHITARSGQPADVRDGVVVGDGWVAGTYLHGLFDDDALRQVILKNLAERKGITRVGQGARFDRNADYDRLAAAVRASLDMDALRRIVGL
jgi:adenosylcobyric acid synthase